MDAVDHNVRNVWLSRALGHNPLVRCSDRVEAALAAVVAAVLLFLIPVACAVGTEVHETKARALTEYMATHRQVSAQVIAESVGPADLYTPGAVTRVQWTDGGRIRTDAMFSREWHEVGDALGIWVDQRGERTPPPPESAVPAAVTAAMSVWVGAAAVAATLLGVLRVWLDRRRYAVWEQEYQLLVG